MFMITNESFLYAIFGGDYLQAHVTSFAHDPGNIPPGEQLRSWIGDYFSAGKLQPKTNQYFTISTFTADEHGRARRRKALFKATHCIMLDDVREKLSIEEVQRLPAPSYILETSPGSEQWVYILTQPATDRHRVENLLDGLVAKGLAPDGKDPGMKGVTRYARLPEGINNKTSKLVNGQPFQCHLKEWAPENKCTLEQLAEPFGIDLDKPRRESRVDGAADVAGHPLLSIDHLVYVKSVRSNGRFDITCPWVDEHTKAEDSGTAVFTNADGTIGFKCHHGHCQHRTGRDLLELIEQHEPGFGQRFTQWKVVRMLADVSEVSFMEPAPAPATTQPPSDPMRAVMDRLRLAEHDSPEAREIVSKLLRLVDELPVIEKTGWHKDICATMQWSKKEFEAILKDLRSTWFGDYDQLDQLQLAEKIIASLEPENIIADGAGVWSWQSTGVWKLVQDRALKQMVQRQLARILEQVNHNTVQAVYELMRNEIYQPGHQWNRGNPESVNCLNGELVLLNGVWQLQPHTREHFRTVQVPVEYDQQAECPRFQQFLAELFNGDPDSQDKARALLEMMGYSLMSHSRYERFVLLVGMGSNGKSVVLKLMEALAGAENVAAVQPSNFSNTFQRAQLKDKLVNIVTELKSGELIDDAGMKAITSGETMTVERKFGDPFEMQPCSTIWLGTNHMPHTRDFSDGLFRRALVVPFNNRFTPDNGNCDPMLGEKLKAELPGILNACLSAYAEAVHHGFTTPDSTKEARKAWRMEADQVMQFVDDRCRVSPGAEVAVSFLYDSYQIWCKVNGIRQPLKSRKFGERMELMGYPAKKGTGGIRMRSGISLDF